MLDEDCKEGWSAKATQEVILSKEDKRMLEDFHGLKEAQRKRLLKYMEALKQIESLEDLYGYEVKRLNAQVKNNISRFPDDFMFQLTKSEMENLRSNFSTANISPKSRALPHAFTEQGIYMLATVLRGELAEFVTESEMRLVTAKVSEISVQVAGITDCHDRLIVIDYGSPTEQAYHCGASSKDAGRKLCAINKIENTAMIHPVIDHLLRGADKVIGD